MEKQNLIVQLAPITENGENYYILEEWDKAFTELQQISASTLLCSQFVPLDFVKHNVFYRMPEDKETFETAIKNELTYYQELIETVRKNTVLDVLVEKVGGFVGLEHDYADYNTDTDEWIINETSPEIIDYNIDHYLSHQKEFVKELEVRVRTLEHIIKGFHYFSVLEEN